MNRLLFLLLSTVLLTAGCGGTDGPDLGYVEGTVKMDGKPVPNAVLTFQPENARPSYGRTNEEGWYELVYTDEKLGATVGTHQVRITTGEEGDEDSGVEGQKERIPAKYNVNSELTREVEPADNVIDFDLESEGEIIEQSDADIGPQ